MGRWGYINNNNNNNNATKSYLFHAVIAVADPDLLGGNSVVAIGFFVIDV